MNQCHFLGRLVADPDLKSTVGDKKVVNFRIAVDRRYKRGKETVKEPAFLNCEAWDTGAELIAKHFKKGDPIIVHASVKQDEWDDKTTGQKRAALKFRVNQFDFVPANKGSGDRDRKPSGPAETDVPAAAGDDGYETAAGGDEIPF